MNNLSKDSLIKLRKIMDDLKSHKSISLVALSLCVLLNSGFTTKKNLKSSDISSDSTISSSEIYLNSDISWSVEEILEEHNEELNVSIEEKQAKFLEKYNLNYLDLINAVTGPIWGVDYTKAEKIKAREDFEEIKAEFQKLTQEKLEYALERYSITYSQFYEMTKVMLIESGGINYNETLNVWSSLLNRLNRDIFIDYVAKVVGTSGYSIYDQFICPGAYTKVELVPERYDDITMWPGYYASLDILCSGKVTHNYVEFRSNGSTGGVLLEEGGNRYRHEVEGNWVENPTIKEVKPKKPYSVYLGFIDKFKKEMGLEEEKEDILILRKDNEKNFR